MDRRVLVLNSDYSPLHVTNTKRAVVLMLMDKVDVVELQSNVFWSSSNDLFELPSVIRLRHYVKRPYHDVPLTRQNIHLRDNHQCQYCGSTERLTLDHVVPIKRGGERTWTNLVTACFSCNNRKGDVYPPEKAGLVLRSQPRKPSKNLLFKSLNPGGTYWNEFFSAV